MTGTIDLSIEQLRAIAADVESVYEPVRVVIHPHDSDKAVRVETTSIGIVDVLKGTRIVLRDGTVLTKHGYGEYVRAKYSRPAA